MSATLILQVGRLADDLAAKRKATEQKAAEKEQHRLAQIRAELAAVEPRRTSTRASATEARLRLAKQAQKNARTSEDAGAESESLTDSATPSAKTEDEALESQGIGKEEAGEVEYDPVADMSDNSSDSEGESEEEDDNAESDQEKAADKPGVQIQRKRSKQSQVPKPAGRRKDKKPAEQWEPNAFDISDEDEGDGYDADLQRALAMSLMESTAGQTGPSTPGRHNDFSASQALKEPHQQERNPSHDPVHMPGTQSAPGKKKGKAAGADEKGKGKRKRGFAIDAAPQDIKKAFGMIAQRSKLITQSGLAEVPHLPSFLIINCVIFSGVVFACFHCNHK